jgi:UDP-N-acetylmuramyl pentapeptide synthase
MGDMLELGRMKEQFHYQAGKDIKGVCDIFIAVGALSRLAADTAKSFGFDAKNVFSCSTSLEARDILFNEISPTKDDVVLVKGSRLMKMEEIIK